MQFLPTHCRACGSVDLIQQELIIDAAAQCRACGDRTLVVPGPRFGGHELKLFGELTTVAREAQLRPAEAQRLCIDIEMGLARADQLGTLQRLGARFPELSTLAQSLESSPARQARALRMLETIFNALSIPRKSLSLPSMPVAERRNG